MPLNRRIISGEAAPALTIASLCAIIVYVWLHSALAEYAVLVTAVIAVLCAIWLRASQDFGWITSLLWWICCAHLALWLPFLFQSYLIGEGYERLGYVILASLITAVSVAWYTTSSHPVETLVCGVGLLLISNFLKKRTETSQ